MRPGGHGSMRRKETGGAKRKIEPRSQPIAMSKKSSVAKLALKFGKGRAKC